MAAVCETFLLQTRRLLRTWGRELTQRFRPTSVQFKGRINSDKARKRHRTRHLEFYTPPAVNRRVADSPYVRHDEAVAHGALSLLVRVFQNIEELRHALAEFRERYNQRWIVQRLGYLTPAQARQQLLALGAAA